MSFDTCGFVLKTQCNTGKSDLEEKIPNSGLLVKKPN